MSNIETEFQELASTWARETMHLSSVADMVRHPCYQRIVEMGPAVVPYVLWELLRDPCVQWFTVLDAIFGGRGPEVPPEHRGKIGAVVRLWVEFCLHQGISPAPLPTTH